MGEVEKDPLEVGVGGQDCTEQVSMTTADVHHRRVLPKVVKTCDRRHQRFTGIGYRGTEGGSVENGSVIGVITQVAEQRRAVHASEGWVARAHALQEARP